ncbi:MAG: hypothetical protein KDC26_08955 [Armatimonadetes bacterium]|nr:hypothetical protein [Armatimonadota bacterium]
MKVSVIQFGFREIAREQEFYDHLDELFARCEGSDLIVLPEYCASELLGVVGDYTEETSAIATTPYFDDYVAYLRDKSNAMNAVIVGGTAYRKTDDIVQNICPVLVPGQEPLIRGKALLVPYEKDVQGISYLGFQHKPVIDGVGVAVCYDAEFPALIRPLCEQGVVVLAAPSSTEDIHGFRRVRYSCLARAIENQIYVIHAAIVGSIGREPYLNNYGTSAIIAPSMREFPDGPILAESKLNVEDVISAELDLEKLELIREKGEVRNWHDRSEMWKG